MKPLGNYSFLPWLRHGIANTITAADHDQAVKARATTHVVLNVAGDPVGGGAQLAQSVSQDVELYGPGDVVGIDPRAVVRTEPRDWITNFEANYLAAVDFYDEDFPWRYTPAAPDASHLKLRPWISLVVLEESEFEEGRNLVGRPLPYITVTEAAKAFPTPDELGSWAHVHFNQSLTGPGEVVSTDRPAVLARAQAIVDANPDAAYARLLCPRRLKDDTAYHAFVIPTFETGRLAGLGLEPDGAPYATAPAWGPGAAGPQPTEFPVYYRWYFCTGSHGDFEYLVELLKPRSVDHRVGERDMDVQRPGIRFPPVAPPALKGVLRLGGALRAPDDALDDEQLAERQRYEDWDHPYPTDFQRALAAFVDLPDDYEAQAAAAANAATAATGMGEEVHDNPDPVITAPLYGRWHALTQRLLTNRDGSPAPHPDKWVHRLNLDPRFRVPAGFGADVVETNAERYMDYAWQQIGDVLAANARIRRLHLAAAASSRLYERNLVPLAMHDPGRAFTLTAPVHSRVVEEGATIRHAQAQSRVAPALTSSAMRRVVRPGGRLVRSLPFEGSVTPGSLLARVDSGEVTPAPAKRPPTGAPSVDQVSAVVRPKGGARLAGLLGPIGGPGAPAGVGGLAWALVVVALVLALVLGLVVAGWVGLLVFLLLLLLVWIWSGWRGAGEGGPGPPGLRRRGELGPGSVIAEEGQRPAAVDRLPRNPEFSLTRPGAGLSTPAGREDSPVARRFKQALGDSFALISASGRVGSVRPPGALDVLGRGKTVVKAIDPQVTIPRRGFATIDLPDWVKAELVEDFGEVMAYPKIDLPMYDPLKQLSIELLLPNLNLIPPNSITLVETNQRFIESYMVGLNHEFARKLLWREYPTDQRGSYFRQFWDVRSTINSEGLSENALKEKLYDIPELHKWSRSSALGEHNNRQAPGTHEAQAVLVIRGELLKKYPTAVIYAHRARWEFESDGTTPDLSKPRELVDLDPTEEDKPPPEKVRFPLYEAKADPDVYFFGFDLSVKQAKGGSGHPPDVDPGWFFVIKERPGDPRFGLDVASSGSAEVTDELSWEDAMPGGQPGESLAASSLATITLDAPPAGDPEGKQPQHDDDVKAVAAAPSSARWAYLLFRAPVMVAVHAHEMLLDRK